MLSEPKYGLFIGGSRHGTGFVKGFVERYYKYKHEYIYRKVFPDVFYSCTSHFKCESLISVAGFAMVAVSHELHRTASREALHLATLSAIARYEELEKADECST